MIHLEIDDDLDYESFKSLYPKVMKTRYTGKVIDDSRNEIKNYEFTYIIVDSPIPGSYLKWKDKSSVPSAIRNRAFNNIKNLINVIIKMERDPMDQPI